MKLQNSWRWNICVHLLYIEFYDLFNSCTLYFYLLYVVNKCVKLKVGHLCCKSFELETKESFTFLKLTNHLHIHKL